MDCLKRAVELAPDSAEARHNLALALELLGHDHEAIDEFSRCVALDSKHAAALERLGSLLIRYGRRDAAVTCFRQAALREPASLAGRISHANVLIEEDMQAEAEASLRETTIAFPYSVEAKRLLSNVLRQQGRFDEALPLLRAATQSAPSLAATAYHDLVVSKTITAADRPLLRRMRALLDDQNLPELGGVNLHFALGKALDDLGEFQEAMGHFDAANRVVDRLQPFDSEEFAANVSGLTSVFTADFIKAHSGSGSFSEAPLFIIGMPRSGTTLVEQVISCHRDAAAGGELSFWQNMVATLDGPLGSGLTSDKIGRMAAEYQATLRRIGPDATRVTDKNGSNFLWVGLIRIVFPNARIIHCRRNPVDTCLSNYFTNFGAPVPFAYSKANLVRYYRNYVRLMQHWRDILSPDCFYEVDYEHLVNNPESESRRLIEFCGLVWDDACLRPEANQRVVKTASFWQVRQPIFHKSVGRWRNYQPWLGELSELLAFSPVPNYR